MRKAAGLTQAELADAIGVPQTNIAFWEFSEKPPRSDALPKLAQVLGVTVEVLLKPSALPPPAKKCGATGRLLKAFEAASSLPKRQQQLMEQFVSTLAAQRKASQRALAMPSGQGDRGGREGKAPWVHG